MQTLFVAFGLNKHCLLPPAETVMLQVKGSRALIFSQWTSVLDILGWLLDMMGLTYVRLDGSTPVADRLPTVDL